MTTRVLLVMFLFMVNGCAINSAGQVGADERVFNKERVIPLGAGLLGAVVCNKLFDGHGSKDSWTAICGVAGYFASVSFLSQHKAALENNKIGETSSWTDPDGKTHSVTPTATFHNEAAPCREFRQTVEIDGQIEILSGKACRSSNGEWKLVR